MRMFLLVALAHVIALFGIQLTGFGLGIWVYQQTGSTTLYGLSVLSTLASSLVLSPVAGVLVDRWSLRATMIAANAGAGICLLVAAKLAASDTLTVGTAIALVAAAAAFNAAQLPGLSAVTAMMVPGKRLGRANGVIQVGTALSGVLAPASGTALFAWHGLAYVFTTGGIAFAIAFSVLAHGLPAMVTGQTVQRTGRLQGALLEGIRYVRGRPGFWGLLAAVSTANFNLTIVHVLVPPLLLTIADVKALATVAILSGMGMLAGSVVLLVWGRSRRLVHGLLGFVLLQSLMLMVAGTGQSVRLMGASAFGVMFLMPLIAGFSQTLWQRKVPQALQGSVFALRLLLGQSGGLLALMLAGPLVDYIFEPLLSTHGALASSVGEVLGVGPGRGTALFLIVLGLQSIVIVTVAWLSPRVHRLDDEVPDQHGLVPNHWAIRT